MESDMLAVAGSVLLSLVAVPTALGYLFVLGDSPAPGSTAFLAVGTTAMLPGFLLGGTALWLAARG